MKAALFSEYGGPEVVRIEDVDVPEPGPGEARIRVAASALNHLDLWVRRGIGIETTMPHIGGSDIAGIVDSIGPMEPAREAAAGVGDRVVVDPSLSCGECEWCAAGQESMCGKFRIIGEHTNGGFAEYVVVPARNLLRVPGGYPLERAAAAPLPFLTAWRGLISRGRLRPGELVLITGASGGVSTCAIQVAKHAGAHVFTVTTADNIDRVRELGADVVYDRDSVDFSKEVWRDTGKRGVDLILDSVGTATWTQNVRALARGGRLVVYGATSGPRVETDARLIFAKQLEIIGTTMSNRAEFHAVMALVFDGLLEPVVDVVWPLDQARAAHERLEAGKQFGKIVLVP